MGKLTREMRQSKFARKAKKLIIQLFQLRSPKARFQRSLIVTVLLFVLSMAVTPMVAQVPKSTPIVQSQPAPVGLVERAKKLYETGDLEEAAADLQQAADAFAASGDRLNQGMALSNLSLIYQQLGQWELAKQVINQSLELLETQPQSQERSRILAQTLDIQGQIQRELGQPEEALKTWQKATEISTQIENKDGATQSQINQVLALQDLGLYPRACNTLLAVLELDIQDCDQLTPEKLTEKLPVFQERPVSAIEVQGLRHLGELLQVLVQPIQSQIVLEASLNLAKQLDPAPDKNSEIAAVHLSLGNTARVRGNFEEALQHYQQAAKSATVTTQIQAQLNQLSLLVKRRSWSEVPNLASKIKSSLNDLPASRRAVEARINLAQSLICFKEPTLSDQERKGSSPILQQCILTEEEEKSMEENTLAVSEIPNWEEIAEIVAAAVEQAETLGNERVKAYALGYLGGAYQQRGNFAEAQQLTQKALQSISAFNAPNIAYLWQWQLGRIRRIQGEQEGALTAYTLAFETLNSLRADLVATNPEIQLTFRESVEPVYRELVALLLQQENPSQDNLKQARQVIQSLQLAELNDFLQLACGDVKPEQIDAVADQATPATAAFYTIFLQDRLEVILKLPQQATLLHYTTLLPENRAENVLQQLQQSLLDVTRAYQVRELSQEVYKWLIEPVETQLEESGVQTLVFVLDNPLRNIPMGVLYDGNKYLVEKYAIAVSPGLQLLSPQPLGQVGLNTLIGGLSQKRQFGEEGEELVFPPLENVRSELDEIESLVPSVELFDDTLTATNLQTQIKKGKFSVVHLATHGQFSSNPQETFILLSDKLLKLKDWESLLQAGDPSRSTSIELLVLSACETAVGDERAVLGLAGIAVKAGARSTLATLWSVTDPSAASLMGQFYRELKKPNVTKAEALQTAQLSLLQEEQRPYFWAPYILVGNWL